MQQWCYGHCHELGGNILKTDWIMAFNSVMTCNLGHSPVIIKIEAKIILSRAEQEIISGMKCYKVILLGLAKSELVTCPL